MLRLSVLLFAALFALSACESNAPKLGTDGKPLPQVYRITARDSDKIQFRMLDAINALRQASGAQQVALNAQLNAAAATHSRDMSVQNRPWHFGSDGSSPLDRVRRAGYYGSTIGENISETYETELETLAAWMDQKDTRDVILEPSARDLGVAWYQEESGKIWWTIILGS